MIEQWENISRNIEAKFADPDFYRNAPGTPLPELLKELEELFQKDSGLPRHIAKARGKRAHQRSSSAAAGSRRFGSKKFAEPQAAQFGQ